MFGDYDIIKEGEDHDKQGNYKVNLVCQNVLGARILPLTDYDKQI
jgi:hypothetical protein